ncbi:MAG: sulfurtransferase-like selenium metabolism protein YedF [Chloroflexia bacterium]
MARVVDARGLPCPQPVLRAKEAMEKAREVIVIVDGPESAENVRRTAEKAGWAVFVDGKEEGVYVHLVARAEPQPEACAPPLEASGGPLVLLVPCEVLGRGEHAELGSVLMRSFVHTLLEVQPRPDVMIFLNSGVKLVVEGSPLLEDLQELERRGVRILACGTCLGYYGLKDRVAAGTVSNMYTIAETLLTAGRLISL